MRSERAIIDDFQALTEIKPLYFLPREDFAEEVLIPAFQLADKADCMVGFFSSEALSSLAPGLATYINHSTHSFRLIISPFLRPEDFEAIERGLSSEEVAVDLLENLIVTEDLIQKHTLKCLSYLLQAGRIEIKVALLKKALFHPKVWIFEKDDDEIVVHGSSNMTRSGIRSNFEQVTVSKSWFDSEQKYMVQKFRDQFQKLWENEEEDCVIIPIPRAIEENIIRNYPVGSPPTEQDFRELFRRATEDLDHESDAPSITIDVPHLVFAIPDWLEYEDGPFEHQGKAVSEWCSSDYRGVLEMATGSGKTITSMICAYRLYEEHQPLLIIIAAPYIPLIQQWCGEIETFGLKPIDLTTFSGPKARAREISNVRRRLRTGLSNVEVMIVSHVTLCKKDFKDAIASFDCSRLLIGDEAHNLGRLAFVSDPPEFFEYRLALSATPIRQYDEEGTDAIFSFFGPIVFPFTLKEAIGRCLVEYSYHVHPIYLTNTEMDNWSEITGKIKRSGWRKEDGKPDKYLAKLYRDRRVILETAQNKVVKLAELLDREDLQSLRHTLIYSSDKQPDQLDDVNTLLRERGVLYHQLTEEETSNRKQTQRIISSFQEGELQVLTAKRVLDEGVNIPQITTAFILASTTVERQWIQRRGRLLRTCKAIGKTHSIIHDFLALPSSMDEGLDEDARTLVRSELHRIQEFASLAKNAGKPDGPLPVIDKIVKAMFF